MLARPYHCRHLRRFRPPAPARGLWPRPGVIPACAPGVDSCCCCCMPCPGSRWCLPYRVCLKLEDLAVVGPCTDPPDVAGRCNDVVAWMEGMEAPFSTYEYCHNNKWDREITAVPPCEVGLSAHFASSNVAEKIWDGAGALKQTLLWGPICDFYDGAAISPGGVTIRATGYLQCKGKDAGTSVSAAHLAVGVRFEAYVLPSAGPPVCCWLGTKGFIDDPDYGPYPADAFLGFGPSFGDLGDQGWPDAGTLLTDGIECDANGKFVRQVWTFTTGFSTPGVSSASVITGKLTAYPCPAGEGLLAARAAPARLVAGAGRPAGPGSHLARLLRLLGLTGCSSCDGRAARMDAWGVEGCREKRAEIVGWLREQQAKAGWLATFKAGAFAVAAGLPVNPLDPLGWLVDESIRRAETKAGPA